MTAGRQSNVNVLLAGSTLLGTTAPPAVAPPPPPSPPATTREQERASSRLRRRAGLIPQRLPASVESRLDTDRDENWPTVRATTRSRAIAGSRPGRSPPVGHQCPAALLAAALLRTIRASTPPPVLPLIRNGFICPEPIPLPPSALTLS